MNFPHSIFHFRSFRFFAGFFLLLFIIGITTFYYRQPFAYFSWQHFHLDRLSSFLAYDDANMAFTMAEYYFNHGNYDIQKAEKYYQKAIALRPDFLEAHYQLGRIHFINSRFDTALTEIRIVLTLNPEFKKAYYMYGLISGYAGDLEGAEYGFIEFINRDGLNWAGYNDLAWVYFKQGDYEKTHDIAKNGLEHAPGNPWLNNIYGTALLNLNQKAEARVAFEIALAATETMTPEDWGRAYPGNNPDLYAAGFEETRSVIRHNLTLVSE